MMHTDPSRHWKVLELDKILEMLADQTTLSDAANLARNLSPSADLEEVESRLAETDAAYALLARFGAPSFGSASSPAAAVARAEAGGVLTRKELLDLAETLRIVRSVQDWSEHAGSEAAMRLGAYFDALTPNKYFEDKIFFCIKSEDEMHDNASPDLADLRRKIRSASLNIRDRLEKIVRSQSYAKYLQDALITQRDGRFVVPVKAEYRSEIPGLVHDTSGSGATLFVEPMAVVEINNDLRVLRLKEQQEIERILSELSAEAASFGDPVLRSYEALLQLNFVFAKAHLAYRMKASLPKLNQDGRLVLKRARHPLIPEKQVVPITVSLGVDYDSLVITGPNTGGKTVALKTIGLLTLMAMCGLMIPADDFSEIAVFGKVLADIGDEQSIEQSLSTFSSHMTNIVSILKDTGEDTLVLLDELGAGTDPVEGAALAKAILITLARRGAKLAATTHYAELKSYALEAPRVENASCEFDVETLKPTYRLLIGVPGRSNAFAISTKLGLEPEIVEEAKSFLTAENLRFERVVAALEEERSKAERASRQLEEMRAELALAKRKADQQAEDLARKREALLDQARKQAMQLADRTRAQANRLLDELETLKKQATNGNAAELALRARRAVRAGLSQLDQTADPVIHKEQADYALPRPLKAGDRVLLRDLNKEADVIEVGEKEALVLAGILKTWVPIQNLKLVEKSEKRVPKERTVKGITSRAERSTASEIDLRGMASDEALLELDRFIDNAVLSGIEIITIIHGKGTGVLRSAVRQHLKRHKNIRTFRPGVFGEGEDGVTIAELKS